jgi:hypothetical protein
MNIALCSLDQFWEDKETNRVGCLDAIDRAKNKKCRYYNFPGNDIDRVLNEHRCDCGKIRQIRESEVVQTTGPGFRDVYCIRYRSMGREETSEFLHRVR